MIVFLRFILVVIVLVYLFRFLLRIFIPIFLKKFSSNYQTAEKSKKEGTITIEKNNVKQKKKTNYDGGEYVKYEEID